ncbi:MULTISPECIES: hypothetical protein [unclassified Frankia]|uniref:hypothetical protein n=1 Tax=unclassified Frankia TaxID=2632575 RepID=UPI002AD543D5|nr:MULTISPECIES: hypothetical protein [unclassified Frankia]
MNGRLLGREFVQAPGWYLVSAEEVSHLVGEPVLADHVDLAGLRQAIQRHVESGPVRVLLADR